MKPIASILVIVVLILTCGIASATDSWPMFRHDINHTGSSEDGVDFAEVSLIWNFTADNWIASSPAIVDSVVYIGSYDGKLYALNASSGVEMWNYSTGSSVVSSPTVLDGVVYFGSRDGNVYALNASSGVQVWNYTTGGSIESTPAVVDGVVFFGSRDNKTYAFNATSGAHMWNYTTGNEVISSPALFDGVLFIGSTDNLVYALNATTGAHMWNYTTGGEVWSSPAVTEGVVIVGSYDAKLYALNASTGALVWNYTTDGMIASSPAVVDALLVIGSLDNKTYAFGPSQGGDDDAMVGNSTIADNNITEGSDVNASLQIYSTYNDTFTARILVNGSNLWNSTFEMQEAPGWSNFSFTIQSSELSIGEYLLNFTVYNSSGSFIDWDAEQLTVTSSGAESLSVNKRALDTGTIRIGDIVQYLINITNTGQENITNITIIDNYDIDLNYTTASTTPTVIDYTNRIVNWTDISTNLENNESFNLYVNMSAIIYADRVGNIVNVTAVDSLGNITQASTNSQIAILPLATSELIGLTIGWNLISIPLVL